MQSLIKPFVKDKKRKGFPSKRIHHAIVLFLRLDKYVPCTRYIRLSLNELNEFLLLWRDSIERGDIAYDAVHNKTYTTIHNLR